MPGNVNGSIGNQPVELNNAATESTLAQLLAEVKKHNPALVGAVKQLAQSAGLRADEIKKFEDAASGAVDSTIKLTEKQLIVGAVMQDLTAGAVQTAKNLAALTSNVMDGTLAANNFFNALQSLPMGLGKVAQLFSALATIQQQSLESYRVMSVSGINFGGDLNKIRQSAAATYLTLDQFTNLMKTQSTTFAKMGGNVNDGAQAFVKLSSSLIRSDSGRYLQNLGYTAEQVNSGLAEYINMTGGRNAQELKNTKAITESAAEYMTQLDGLASVTGKSREQQEQQLKEAAKNAAWEAKLQGMSEEEKKKAVAGLASALAVGGKGAADAFQSRIMGVPPITKEAQMFTSAMGETNETVMKSADAVKDGTKGLKDMNEYTIDGMRASQRDMSKYGEEMVFQQIAAGTEFGKQAQVIGATANRSKQQSDESIRAALDADQKKKKLEQSQAAQAVDVERAFKELTIAVGTVLLPVVKLLTHLMNNLITPFKDGIIKGILNLFTSPLVLGPVALSIVGLFASMKAKAAILEKGGFTAEAESVRGAAQKTKGVASKIGKMGAIGLVGGGLDFAGEKLKESGNEKLGAGASALGSAAQGAALGMMLGPIGAAVGGALGGIYGLYQNKDILMGNPKEEKRAFGSLGMTGKLFEDFGAGKSVELHGMEAVVTPDQMTKLLQGSAATGIGSLSTDIQQLNAMTSQMVRTLATIADNTKRTVDATKSLNGNLFAR